MPEIRSRLVLDGSSYGFMEVARPPDPGRLFSALDVACPSCGADTSTRCKGDRFCAERIELTRQLIASGELESRGVSIVRPASRPNCERQKLRGRPLPCADPAHRCVRITTGHRCRIVIEHLGSDVCSHHGWLKRDVPVKVPRAKSTPLRPAAPKRTPRPRRKLSEEQHAEIRRLYEAGGISIAALARQYGVTPPTIRKALDKA